MAYTFTGWTSDSMLLMPPPTANNLNPLYRISVALNLSPFAPLSYVTTVQRGGNMQGQFVGSFELSTNQRVAILTMGDSTTRLKNVMWNIGGVDRAWGWPCGPVDLRWDCHSTLDDGSPMCVCYDGISNSDVQLASFVPPPIDASPPLPPAQLTVFPDGHQHLDHILLSALIVERKRSLIQLQ
ncbi:hypothetical protein SERLA73DRAFT_178274 [Serpula lacrymans var. lacrymans S7.3]|uniref:Uncharacterized protein n=2 Tax=Serpula lacrymans var. lacrymans TaxID=341189 RepID=F8PR82_SERL3|nr:uncharacterized protein SERLADRAFT_462596 [Serpula lacrymans var. lacrymans S7.9]EGO02373.1 hypothetical protein SERLA73DRAFT_178274 [Serpula lacrymans var. lacrymans S7.3]EGO28101.1 hypothetical protein SERLADRAFT_462596 [Serpula lacrymans var. lacrymans S7.9]